MELAAILASAVGVLLVILLMVMVSNFRWSLQFIDEMQRKLDQKRHECECLQSELRDLRRRWSDLTDFADELRGIERDE